MTTLFHTTNTSTLEFDSSVPCIIDTLNSFLLSEEFRTHLDKGLEFALDKKSTYQQLGWLGDTRSGEAFFDDDLQWLMNNWLPRAANAGIGYIATVLPQGDIAQFAADNMKDNIDEIRINIHPNFRYFHDVQSAKEWLRKSLNH
jgi:hypothetical protein